MKKNMNVFLAGVILGLIVMGIGLLVIYRPMMLNKESLWKESVIAKSNTEINAAKKTNETSKKLDKDLQVLNNDFQKKMKQTNFVGSFYGVKDNEEFTDTGLGYANASKKMLNGKDSMYSIASIQKVMTAILLGQALLQTKHNLDEPLSNFLPDVPNAKNVTLRSMLQMVSGYGPQVAPKGKNLSGQKLYEYIINNMKMTSVGTYKYAPVNYLLLTFVIEKLTGKSYEDYFKEVIKQPLGLAHTDFQQDIVNNEERAVGYKSKTKDNYKEISEMTMAQYNYEKGTGNLFMSSKDLFKVLSQYLKGNIVPMTMVRELNRPEGQTTYCGGLYHNDSRVTAHGMERGFEPTVLMSYDGKSGIVSLGNMKLKEYTNMKSLIRIYPTLFKQDQTIA
ncbi:serine hydrolase domain-containing protein [Dellaglioa algida]|uniref:Serine hydrolase n=2 Tax=Dellaglioa algida TaxID=105612 RepID=A0A2C8EPV1_9LACO|nr:serine hydrolase domain-containing protein [Dellaglioa algida]MDK1716157.1 beta-lactamase family protein [Dellaglioa algida]MDK1717846.1 beta-lactamase family protein [Dellaglioa algida]MDK1719438.1 beta-lactamase family protein [Dellaglioa algida]MDK1721060.1 beta-lactamase family protein [Dellaglioa algida]MDK1722781.1 beta-lactamase family protein [Dellaglioa algida]